MYGWITDFIHGYASIADIGDCRGSQKCLCTCDGYYQDGRKKTEKEQEEQIQEVLRKAKDEKIIDRIKELNEVLPEVFLVDLLYLLAGELVIWFLVPNKQMCAVGFLMGVVYSIFSSVHMSFRIRKIVYGHANESKTLLIGYFIRLAVMLVLFTVLYLFHIGDLLCALIGMFSMKVSAYLQPFTNKILSKKGR